MKRYQVLVLLLVIALVVMSGCNRGGEPDTDFNIVIGQPAPDEPEETDLPDDTDDADDEESPDDGVTMPPGSDKFSEEHFPRGTWTIDQLEETYSGYFEVVAYYYSLYQVVYLTVNIHRMQVHFAPIPGDQFSFFKETLEDGLYDVSDSDKKLKGDVIAVYTSDSTAPLPYGFVIGKSTRADVEAAFPAGTLVDGYMDSLGCYYDEEDMPYCVYYYFDDDDILDRVEILWEYFDL